MRYQLDYLFVAFLLLLMILFYSLYYVRKSVGYNRPIQVVIGIALADIVLDLVTAVFSFYPKPSLIFPGTILNILFFCMHAALPWAMAWYSQQIRRVDDATRKKAIKQLSILPVIMALLSTSSPLTKAMFYYLPDGTYCRGHLQILMYSYSAAYFIFIAIFTLLKNKEYRRHETVVLCISVVLDIIFMGIQVFLPQILLTGFATALTVTLIYLTVCNPNQQRDPLTGAYHMQSLDLWLRSDVHHVKYIFVDLCAMNQFNKIYGIVTGDKMLINTVREMRKAFSTDKIFRVSGHRFLAAVESGDACSQGIDALMDYFSHPIHFHETTVTCPAIICPFGSEHHITDVDQMLAYSAYLISQCKDKHQAVLLHDDHELWNDFCTMQDIELYLDQAINEDLFTLNYQPIWSVRQQAFTSMEVLSRLPHPLLGVISPDVFIPMAETNGNIDRITQLQFRRLCRFLKQHPALLDKLESVKFNLSPHEMIAHRIEEQLLEMIREHSLPCDKFQFEITESAAMEYSGPLSTALKLLSDNGISLCMDDFGTGYANLSEMSVMPYSTIKMDRSLLRNVLTDPHANQVYRTMINLFGGMGYATVAEGVESADEMTLIESWGVDYIQGFHLARPMDGQRLLKFFGIDA